MSTHYNILAWKIPWTKEPGGLQSMRLQRVRHDFATKQQLHSNNMFSVHIFYWMNEDLLLRQEKWAFACRIRKHKDGLLVVWRNSTASLENIQQGLWYFQVCLVPFLQNSASLFPEWEKITYEDSGSQQENNHKEGQWENHLQIELDFIGHPSKLLEGWNQLLVNLCDDMCSKTGLVFVKALLWITPWLVEFFYPDR